MEEPSYYVVATWRNSKDAWDNDANGFGHMTWVEFSEWIPTLMECDSVDRCDEITIELKRSD